MKIEAPSDFLEVPFKFLRDPTAAQGEEYLSQLHPAMRSILDVGRTTQLLDEMLLRRLITNDDPLKILIVGSNTAPDIPGADAEALVEKQTIAAAFSAAGITPQITYPPTQQATLRNVEDALSAGPLDVMAVQIS